MPNTNILFRGSVFEEEEYRALAKHFNQSRNRVFASRAQLPDNSTVIARYSALPYYDELEKDLQVRGSRLINTWAQHRYVADMAYWYLNFKDLTPKTWFYLHEAILESDGPFVVKGTTNSRKHLWNTHMYAENIEKLVQVHHRLSNDGLIGSQNIVVREYEPFVSYGTAIGGLPITKEFRFFIFAGKVIAKGFYWGNQPEVLEQYKPDVNEVPEAFIQDIIKRVDNQITFWVVDVAQHQDGRWRIIEFNDGQQSGLSTIDPDEFYCNLYQAVAEYDDAFEQGQVPRGCFRPT